MTWFRITIEGTVGSSDPAEVEQAVDWLAEMLYASPDFKDVTVGATLSTSSFDLEAAIQGTDTSNAFSKIIGAMEAWKDKTQALLGETHLVPA